MNSRQIPRTARTKARPGTGRPARVDDKGQGHGSVATGDRRDGPRCWTAAGSWFHLRLRAACGSAWCGTWWPGVGVWDMGYGIWEGGDSQAWDSGLGLGDCGLETATLTSAWIVVGRRPVTHATGWCRRSDTKAERHVRRRDPSDHGLGRKRQVRGGRSGWRRQVSRCPGSVR